ncbi:MAG: HIT domain-containing protein [Mycoplasma sp.]|nr:HIT domain-containing protein [Mycoplasma sp.]
MNTLFQKIINNEIPSSKVFEDENFVVILDINPKSLGHTLVIPKKFSRNLISIDDETLSSLFILARKIANNIIEKIEVDGYQIVTNSEASSHQEIFHTHVHIIPSPSNKKLNLNELLNLIKMG